jgi:hypothetical protein
MEHLDTLLIEGRAARRNVNSGNATFTSKSHKDPPVRASFASLVPYMDSAELRSISRCLRILPQDQTGFCRGDAADRIVTLFKVARVDMILPIFATLEAAEQKLARAVGA